MTSSTTPGGLARFNALEDAAARAALHEVCASTAWGRTCSPQRPYATAEALYAASDAAMAELTADDLRRGDGRAPADRPPQPG